ncbi:MAG: ComEC family competence protein [Amoebophilaceae bacterium]|jgi:competence protein ComEC|nr:ComEC family competence protein [Amoebophilaceae bacterium]
MSPWSSFPFVRITLALVGGILAARYWEGQVWMASGLLSLLLLVYVSVVMSVSPTTFRAWSPWIGFLGLGSTFLLGYVCWLTHEVRSDLRHLTHCSASIEAYEAIVSEDVHRKSARSNVIVSICRARIQGQWQQVQGKVLLSFPNSAVLHIRYGDVLMIQGRPRTVPAARNPHEFDYAAFLGISQTYHQHFVLEKQIAVMAHQPPNIVKVWSFQVLRYCQSLFTQYIRHPEARAVAMALVLGQKDTLTPEVSTSYIRTGTMHVLAVSGLHVGILYWCLRLLLKLLSIIWKARWLSPAISLAVLWLYAFVTGLAPSVLRATTMFTFMVTASMLGRPTSIYNTLAASAFLLLFWHPMLLFAVGFQLSYLAVLGIVHLQPRIYKLLTLHNQILDKLWLLSSISIGAQVATAPCSLYYFHQFPTYFVVANWVVVPAALVILCLGLFVLMTSCWASLSVLVAWLLENVVLSVNAFVRLIQKLPWSLVESVHLNVATVLLLYGILLLFLVFLHTKSIKYLIVASMSVILLSLHSVREYCIRQVQRKVIFYSIDHHQITAFIQGCHSTLCVDNHFQLDSQLYTYHIQPSQRVLGITSSNTCRLAEAIQQKTWPIRVWEGLKVVVWQGKKFIFIDQDSKNLPHLSTKVHTDFLVIGNNAIKTIQPLLDRFDFGILVIGTSNQIFLAQRLQEEAIQHGVRSHFLSQQGALTVSW